MNLLATRLQQEIEQSGPITFARFMERALYEPELGYYERQKEIGRRGDFFTSVSVGNLFGKLLAFQFSEWRNDDCELSEKQKSPFQIVEAGAHDGRLAADILKWFHEFRPEFFSKLEYWIIEPSATRRQWQQKTLADFAPQIKWAADISKFAVETNCESTGVNGIIFSNELLDAMPVHRLRWNAAEKKWRECVVGWNGQKFIWELAQPISKIADQLPQLPDELTAILPDGFTTEISPAATDWWRQAVAVLNRGKLLTIDYGLTQEEFFLPERSRGTLRAFAQHHFNEDLLANVGEQDLTTHINFSALQIAGENAGLQTEGLIAQSKFLTRIAERTWKEPEHFGKWTAERVKQFQTLTHPEHLGRSFRALIQARAVEK